MNILTYYGMDTIIVLLVNFFFIDYKLTLLSILILVPIFEKNDSLSGFGYVVTIIFLILTILRLIILPILYGYMENHSKDKIVLGFIQNLRKSWKWKFGVLSLTMTSLILPTTGDYSNIYIAIIIFTGFSSYLILFIWWWIQDLIKKKKNEIV